MANYLFLNNLKALCCQAANVLVNPNRVDLFLQYITLGFNNTPPASRQISAPRGVTRFWGAEK